MSDKSPGRRPRRHFTDEFKDGVLRLLILKHLHDWSFDEEVRANLAYRAFTRIGRRPGLRDVRPRDAPLLELLLLSAHA